MKNIIRSACAVAMVSLTLFDGEASKILGKKNDPTGEPSQMALVQPTPETTSSVVSNGTEGGASNTGWNNRVQTTPTRTRPLKRNS
ncbi:hypothetical protein FACS189449_13360 [Alphaproteobacteria bacterium]|nr:hypothetical protein FACS189449_13360 [Alphaproteobacteria bacterium]